MKKDVTPKATAHAAPVKTVSFGHRRVHAAQTRVNNVLSAGRIGATQAAYDQLQADSSTNTVTFASNGSYAERVAKSQAQNALNDAVWSKTQVQRLENTGLKQKATVGMPAPDLGQGHKPKRPGQG